MMDHDKTKGQLIKELLELRQHTAELQGKDINGKQAEDQLKQEKKRLESLINHSSLAIVTLDENHNIISCNEPFVVLFQFEESEIKGRNLDEVIARREYMKDAISYTTKTLDGKPIHGSGRRFRKDGTLIDVEFFGVPVDIDGKVVGAYGIYLDVSERVRAEKALQESEEKYRTILESIQDGYFEVDIAGNFTFFNDALRKIYGRSQDELIGKHLGEFTDEETARKGYRKFNEVYTTGKPAKRFDWEITGKEGVRKHVEASVSLMRDSEGRRIGFQGILRDITERKRTEEALRESEEKNRMIVENANEAIIVIQDGIFKFGNPKSAESTGYSVRELASRPFADIIHPDDRHMVLERYRKRVNGEDVPHIYTFRIIDKDGQIKWIRVNAVRVTWEKKPATLAFLSDISERTRAEEALQESEEKYRQLVKHAPAGIYEIDTNNLRFMSVNDVMCDYTGYSKEELLSMNVLDLLTEDSKKRLFDRQERVFSGEKVPETTEYKLKAKDGREFWVLANAKFMYEDERLTRATVVVHDITERKKMEEELSKIEKLESTGILAGGIAHDFNNILAAIMGNISLAKTDVDPGDRVYGLLEEAERASARATALTRQLLTFSKGGSPIKRTASIAEVIRESTAFALRGSAVRCEFIMAEGLWPVQVDVGQISQVINNLAINAGQAMPQGGVIEVGCENMTAEATDGLPLHPGKYLKVSIKDQGIGIPEEHLSRIFDPYFTTKHKGSGLGLATAYSIIKKHDGHITVESQLGAGTTFHVYLPASEKTIQQSERKEKRPIAGKGKVLVMDDEETIRRLATRMLDRLGYEAELANDGDEAFELYKNAMESGEPFDVVILDLTIAGGLGGKEAIQKLLEIDPEINAIVSSGYSSDPIMSDFEDYGFRGVIAKPYNLEELSRALNDVIPPPQLH